MEKTKSVITPGSNPSIDPGNPPFEAGPMDSGGGGGQLLSFNSKATKVAAIEEFESERI